MAQLKDIGSGRIYTVATTIAVLIREMIDEPREKMTTLNAVMIDAQISPEDIAKFRANEGRHLGGDWDHDEKYSWEIVMFCARGEEGIEYESESEEDVKEWIEGMVADNAPDHLEDYYEIVTYTKAELDAMPEV